MKASLIQLAVATVLAVVSISANAQDGKNEKAPKSKFVSDKGFWVIESNVKTPKSSTVYFYNNQNDLVYKEQMEGVKLNVKKDKTLNMLKQVLDKYLQQPAVAQATPNDHLVKDYLSKRN